MSENTAYPVVPDDIGDYQPDEAYERGFADAVEAATPTPESGDDQDCVHCPDGHRAPTSRPWAVWVAAERDSDGQPTHLTVATTGGHHVAESDAEWLRRLIRRSPAVQVDAAKVIEQIATGARRDFKNPDAWPDWWRDGHASSQLIEDLARWAATEAVAALRSPVGDGQ